MHVVNLDPAAESFAYTPEVDVRELVTADDVMEMMDLGPNGALVYCMEYLLENLGWLEVRPFPGPLVVGWGRLPVRTLSVFHNFHTPPHQTQRQPPGATERLRGGGLLDF